MSSLSSSNAAPCPGEGAAQLGFVDAVMPHQQSYDRIGDQFVDGRLDACAPPKFRHFQLPAIRVRAP
jgi:hypothetical protein